MGIAGAALATILSQLISALLVLTVLMKQPGEGKLELKQIRFHKIFCFPCSASVFLRESN